MLASEINNLAKDWRRHLQSRGRTKRTVDTYIEATLHLEDWLQDRDIEVTRDVLIDYFSDFQRRRQLKQDKPISPAYVRKHYTSLQQFFKWLYEENEIVENPFDRMSPPHVPVKPVPVLSDEQVLSLLAQCTGREFDQIRDTAIIRFFLDTGVRCSELSEMVIEDLDLDDEIAKVLGKGKKYRFVPFGSKTSDALRRYLRARRKMPGTALWVGRKGKMTDQGIREAILRRSRAAGLGRVYPHQLRHTFAHNWLVNGGQETDLMHLAGWKDRQMIGRYGASAAQQRAIQAHRRSALGDRL